MRIGCNLQIHLESAMIYGGSVLQNYSAFGSNSVVEEHIQSTLPSLCGATLNLLPIRIRHPSGGTTSLYLVLVTPQSVSLCPFDKRRIAVGLQAFDEYLDSYSDIGTAMADARGPNAHFLVGSGQSWADALAL